MTELKVWIPTKTQIEGLLQEVLDKLKAAKTISDVPEEWLDDVLNELQCHVSNRAGVESGRIDEG